MMLVKNTLVSKQGSKFKQELKLQDQTNETATLRLQANKIKRKAKGQGLKETLEKEPVHGRYLQRVQQADVDQANTHQRPHSLHLKAETEGFIMAVQDQSLYTRNDQARIMKNVVDS